MNVAGLCAGVCSIGLLCGAAQAEQYRCKDGVVREMASAAAPKGTTVRVYSNEAKHRCYFSVQNEPVNPTGQSFQMVAAFQQTAASIRDGTVLQQLKSTGAAPIATLLFGTSDLAEKMEQRFGRDRIVQEFTKCFRAISTEISRSRVQLAELKAAGGDELLCGFTGQAKGKFELRDVVAILEAPKLYVSSKLDDEQTVVFLPLSM
jgi:hypothetical protein